MINSEVYIRKPILDDVDFMLQLENDRELWKVSQTTVPFTEEEIVDFIVNNKHDLFEELQLRLMIVLKKDNRPIGTLDLFQFDKKKNNAGVGISISKAERGKGFASMAMSLFLEYAFSDLNIDELYCTIFTDNYASIALFESQGFRKQRLMKNYIRYQGNEYDVYFYSLKRIDFYEQRNK